MAIDGDAAFEAAKEALFDARDAFEAMERERDELRLKCATLRALIQHHDCTYGDTPGLIHCPIDKPCTTHRYEMRDEVALGWAANAEELAAECIDLRAEVARLKELHEKADLDRWNALDEVERIKEQLQQATEKAAMFQQAAEDWRYIAKQSQDARAQALLKKET